MKLRIVIVGASLLLNMILSDVLIMSHAADLTLNNIPTQVYFSPKSGCTEELFRTYGILYRRCQNR
jgi:hypothetical protein